MSKINFNIHHYNFMAEAYIFDAVRTPRGKGKKNGALYEVKPIKLLVATLEAIRQRNELPTAEVDDCIIGCVTPILDQGANIAKAALLYADWDISVPGFQINRFCASGLEAVNLAAMKIRSGWEDLIIAGGVESMSRIPIGSDGGALMYDPEVAIKTGYVPQGVSADLMATLEGYSREELDVYALQSQQRAAAAWDSGFFKDSIVSVFDETGLSILEKDEQLRPDTNLEGLAHLSPSFREIGETGYNTVAMYRYPSVTKMKHVHTAGNSSGIVDGAALVLIGSEAKGKALGLKPRARIRAIGTVGTDATLMLQGATAAAEKALAKAGMKSTDIDLWEMNEAFAAPVLKFQRDLNISNDILNVNGGAIAMGHPLGATGAMLLGTLVDELERRNLNTGLVSLCVGGGMGVATIVERV